MFGAQVAAFPGTVVVDGFYGGATTIEAMADYALARLPERFVLLGHSMGARVALEVFRKAHDRVAGLILANTGVHPVKTGEAEKRYALRDIGRQHGIEALVAEWLPPMIAAARRQDALIHDPLEAMCLSAGLATYEAQIEALLSRRDTADVLRQIQCPTLVITGSEDSWAPPAQHEEIALAVSGATLAIVQGAGHMLPFEDPEGFNAEVAALLGKVQGNP